METSEPAAPRSLVEEAWRPLVGELCWDVRLSISQVLLIEFGEPHLRIREPYRSSSTHEHVRARAARRMVQPAGTWHLSTNVCYWQLRLPGKPAVGLEHDEPELRSPLRELDGQRLESFTYDRAAVRAELSFDLGVVLVLEPHTDTEVDDDLWSLYEPNGMVFSLRADGMICHDEGDTGPDEQVWIADETAG